MRKIKKDKMDIIIAKTIIAIFIALFAFDGITEFNEKDKNLLIIFFIIIGVLIGLFEYYKI